MNTELDKICAEILEKDFGYIKRDHRDQWVIFKYIWLIVINPEVRPRIYKKGCKGKYKEFGL